MRRVGMIAWVCVGMLLGCTGSIGDAITEPVQQEQETRPPAPLVVKGSVYRPLSTHEYRNTLASLLGQDIPMSLFANWQPTTTFSGFDGIIWSGFSAKATQDRIAVVEALLDSLAASPRVVFCDGSESDCAYRIIGTFASRAYRRPVTDDELDVLMTRFWNAYRAAKADAPSAHDQFLEGLRVTLGGVLLSPQVLVRFEPPPVAGERDLDAFELASRLSFFMTGAPPDDELWALAKSGAILEDATLEYQLTRLLATHTDAFIDAFAGQLYDFRALASAKEDSLQYAFYRESVAVLREIIGRDLPATTLLHPGFTYANRQLAEHYGLPAPAGDDFERITTNQRGGIMQQGAMLSLTSTATKTSPTRRGRWVQGRILCKTIAPPDPALLEQIAEVSAGIPEGASVKQRVDAHRQAGEACITCHQYMDPIGLGLESFDMLGRTRAWYELTGAPVETNSEFLGTPFDSFDELNLLVAAHDDVGSCLAEKMVVYGLGQMTAEADEGLVMTLSAKVEGHDPSFVELVTRLVTSAPFRRITSEASSL